MAGAPSVFISYSWDGVAHRKWVRELATRLVSNGVRVWLDEWHVRAGDSLTAFMERKIATSGHVLVVCTPQYARKANTRRGGVGYEQQIISGRIEPGELALQPQKRLVHDRPDRSQRMIPPHPRLQVNVAEQLPRSIVVAAHETSPNLRRSK